jgi:mannose-6-phosphate isomerase-like protein (cupin superfamily)
MTAETGRVAVHTVLDTGAGPDGLFRRLVEVPAGARFEGAAGPGGELWFVIAGLGQLAAAGLPVTPVERDTGVWLPPGTAYRLAAGGPGTLRLDSVCLPAGAAGQDGDAVPRLAELGDRPVEVTGDRRFRVLFGPGNGCSAATQFVGEIPPGRAPEHSHPYDEVVLILDGEGVLHSGPAGEPLAPGSCVHLPPGRPHCLENTGQVTLRVLGVFHPGGSPAAKLAPPHSG